MSDAFWTGFFANAKEIILALASLIALIATLLGNRKADKATKTVVDSTAKVNAEVAEIKSTATAAKATAEHAQETVVQEREENRKQFYQIAQTTDVFMAAATAASESGRPPLVPLTDFNELKLEEKP